MIGQRGRERIITGREAGEGKMIAVGATALTRCTSGGISCHGAVVRVYISVFDRSSMDSAPVSGQAKYVLQSGGDRCCYDVDTPMQRYSRRCMR